LLKSSRHHQIFGYPAISLERTEMNMAKNDVLHSVAREPRQDLIEGALGVSLVGPGAVSSVTTLSTRIGAIYTSIGTTLTTNV
jgi:hypothetical protein